MFRLLRRIVVTVKEHRSSRMSSVMEPGTRGGLADSVVALLMAASRRGVAVTRTSLAKLLYLADLRMVEAGGDPVSGARWRWQKYGPYDNRLKDVEDLLVRTGVAEVEEGGNFYGTPEYRLRLISEPTEPNKLLVGFFDSVVAELGHLAPSTLKDLTYQTVPMLDVQNEGQRGDWLDLYLARPVPNTDAVIRRLESVLSRLEIHEDEAGAKEELTMELAEFAPARARATRHFLD
jgi:uncharacterized phage-associated protein